LELDGLELEVLDRGVEAGERGKCKHLEQVAVLTYGTLSGNGIPDKERSMSHLDILLISRLGIGAD
jgi:hypothetical protein